MPLETLVTDLNNELGEDTVQIMSPANIAIKCEVIGTGSIALDRAIGIWGLPRGRIIELFGPESSGKTTLAISAMIQCQKLGGTPALIDVENAFDKTWAKNMGMNMGNMILSQPDSCEHALLLTEKLAASGKVKMIVVDSVASLVPNKELEGDITDNDIALVARLLSKELRKLTGILKRADCCIIFINQIRDKPGVMFGPTETTPGGRALKFFSSIRIDVRRKEAVEVGGVRVGNVVHAKVVKNKLAPPFNETDFNIYYGKPELPIYGIDPASDLFAVGLEMDLVERKGSNYSMGEVKLGLGEASATKTLRSSTELMDKLRSQIRAMSGQSLSPNVDDGERPDLDEGHAEADNELDEPAELEMASSSV